MAPQKLLDTHIHLWPSTALSPTDHAWMKPGHKLAQLHGIDDYKTTISSSPIQPTGFVYVETDRYLPSFVPSISPAENEGGDENTEVCTEKLKIWAKEPLNELKFLRRIVGEAPQEGDGFVAGEGEKLKGMVVWAPFHLSAKLFAAYLDIAKESLGERAWDRVVGFRYLLQGSGVDGVRSVVDSEGFMANLVMIGGLGGGDGRGKVKAFDVGIDCHGDGVEALEIVVGLIEKVRGMSGGKEVRFILNHLCKPDLSIDHWPFFSRYTIALSRLSSDLNVYMKLSGAFNEFAPSVTPSLPKDLIASVKPYFDSVYEMFGAKRLLFASDWPVCNVGGPKGEIEGEERNWSVWRSVVKGWMDGRGLEDEEKDWIWWKSGIEAYGIEGL